MPEVRKNIMKIAHVILAHKNPAQLERLIGALEHPAFDLYIHLDRKSDLSSFQHLQKKNVHFITEREDVQWGGYSLVQAQLNGISAALKGGTYDYINVLSAQDFPIKPADFIVRFFEAHRGTEFISCITYSPESEWWNEALPRVKKYNFQNFRFPGKYRMQFLVNRLTKERVYPLGHQLAGRSQWFSITSGAAAYMLNFLEQHPEVVRFFKFVWGADEFIFSTVLYNSPFREKIKDHLFYIDWSERKPNPKLLGAGDFESLIQSDKLFARKFDLDVDPAIVEKIEQHIGVTQKKITSVSPLHKDTPI
jgi:hypothetical protein